MKRFLAGLGLGFFIALSLSALAIIGGGTLVHNHSSNSTGGTSVIGGTCAVGYTRISANYCNRDPGWTVTGLTNNVCTTITRPSSNAKALKIMLQGRALSNLAIATRAVTVDPYTTNTCATFQRGAGVVAETFEHSAVASDTVLSWSQSDLTLPVDISGNVYVKAVRTGTGNSLGTYAIVGYFD